MTYQASMEFYFPTGAKVILQAKPVEFMMEQIQSLNELRKLALQSGLSIHRPAHWFVGHEFDFAAICGKQLGYEIPTPMSLAYRDKVLGEALDIVRQNHDDEHLTWFDFDTGKDAGFALQQAMDQFKRPQKDATDEKTIPFPGHAQDVDDKLEGTDDGQETKRATTPDTDSTGVEKTEALEKRQDVLVEITCKNIPYKGTRWTVTTQSGVSIILASLVQFEVAGWETGAWQVVDSQTMLPGIPVAIARYHSGWELTRVPLAKAVIPPSSSDGTDVAPVADAVDASADAVQDTEKAESTPAELLRVTGLVNATLLYPARDAWDILEIEKPSDYTTEHLCFHVQEQIQALSLPVAPHQCTLFKDGTADHMRFDTPIGLTLRHLGKKTDFKHWIGSVVYDRLMKGWAVGTKSQPTVIDITPDDLFYLHWEFGKNEGDPLKVVGASMTLEEPETVGDVPF